LFFFFFFFSSRRRHTRLQGDWSSDVCSSDLLYYGNLNDANPPAYGPNVFLDYQDGSPAPGTALDGWTRRDSLGGTPYSTSAGGFVFTEPVTSNSGLYELTKNVANSDVEIFWGFWTTSNNSRGNEAGVGARLSDASV